MNVKKTVLSVAGLAGFAVLCIVMSIVLKRCGTSESGDKKAARTAPAARTSRRGGLPEFGLVRHGLNKQADTAKYGPTSGTYKVSTGSAAEEAIGKLEREENAEDQAQFEEVRVRMNQRDIQSEEEKIASAKRMALAIDDQIVALEKRIRRSEISLAIMEKDLHPGVTRRAQIESFERGLVSDNAKLKSLRIKFDKVSNQVKQSQRLLSNPEKTSHRWTDGRSEIVEEDEE